LNKLKRTERRTVTTALNKVASVASLSDEEFESLATSILQAWEQGRLRELIDEIAGADIMSTDDLLQLLIEADVLVALNIAEAVRTKLEAIRGLRRRIERGELENAVRDYIAEKPYLTLQRHLVMGRVARRREAERVGCQVFGGGG